MKGRLISHRRTVHENDRPFKCENSQKCFGGKINKKILLDQHWQILSTLSQIVNIEIWNRAQMSMLKFNVEALKACQNKPLQRVWGQVKLSSHSVSCCSKQIRLQAKNSIPLTKLYNLGVLKAKVCWFAIRMILAMSLTAAPRSY